MRLLTVRIAQVEAIRFGQAMDAAVEDEQGQHKRHESAAHNTTTIPTGGVAESPHELQLDKLRKLRIAELEASPQHGQRQQNQQPQRARTEPASVSPSTVSPTIASPSPNSAGRRVRCGVAASRAE